MSADDIKAAVALAVEQAMKLVIAGDPPKTKPEASDDAQAKRLEALARGRAKAAANRAAKAGKAEPAKATKKAAKPAAESKSQGPFTVKPYTTKKTKKTGKIVSVGPWSCFVEKGKEEQAIKAINEVFRKGICNDLVDAIRG
jgi:hypothetical protein